MRTSSELQGLHVLDRFTTTFLRGLAVVVPLALTAWILRWLFLTIDRAFFPAEAQAALPAGTGLLLIVLVAAGIGILARHKSTRRYVTAFENMLQRVPIVKLVYGTIKDFVDAFIGKHKRFDKPVMVRITDNDDFQVLGFVTIEDLSGLGLSGRCAVYFPQSYNFGGNLVFLPKERVTPFAMDAGAALSFIMSGGVSTPLDSQHMFGGVPIGPPTDPKDPQLTPTLGASKSPATS